MNEETVPKPYSLQEEARSLFNNPKRSDVRFLVDGQTVYGHKFILAMGSPVFDRMFFGDLKETRDVIEIKDLTLVGFKNALRYIYDFEIDFKLADLYESYVAADKYLLHHFDDKFFEYIHDELSVESSCLIYDQLMKIGDREISLARVRNLIKANKEAFESEHFTRIDQETLIGLLSLYELSIAESDLIAAASKWVDCQLQRQGVPVNCENRRKVFEPIKSYFLFGALKPEQVANSKEIAELLPDEEKGLLLLHLLNKKYSLRIELKTARRATTDIVYRAFVSDLSEGSYDTTSSLLSVNRRVSIRTVHTTYSEYAADLSLELKDSNGTDLDLTMESFVKGGKRCFSFDPPFSVQPDTKYKLNFVDHGDMMFLGDQLSEQMKLSYEELVTFDFSGDDYEDHCVKGFEFLLSD